MTNEEFQNAILSVIGELKSDVNTIKDNQINTDTQLKSMVNDISTIKDNQINTDSQLKSVVNDISTIKDNQINTDTQLKSMANTIKDIKINTDTRLKSIETRQDEIYQVVRAIEHSNQVGKSELDSQNIRLAKVEGKLKRVAKAYEEEIEVDKASNL